MDEEQDAAKKLLLELMEKHPNASQSELSESRFLWRGLPPVGPRSSMTGFQ